MLHIIHSNHTHRMTGDTLQQRLLIDILLFVLIMRVLPLKLLYSVYCARFDFREIPHERGRLSGTKWFLWYVQVYLYKDLKKDFHISLQRYQI